MRTTIVAITLMLLPACTSRPVEIDDEAGVTTAVGESTSVMGDMMQVAECSMWQQDCPEGEKCVPYASNPEWGWNATKCVPIMGDQQPGEPCWWGGIVELTDDCDATSLCLDVMDVDGELVGTCYPFCQWGLSDMPECPPGWECLFCGDCFADICTPGCDPLVQDCAECDMFMQDCPEGEKCVPYASDGDNVWNATKCVPIVGDQQPGEPCWWGGIVGATDDCDATSVCWNVMDVDGESIGTCHAFCQGTADMPECPPGSQCMAPAGYENVGICVLPP